MTSQRPLVPAWLNWASLLLAVGTVAVVAWVCLTAWGAVVHGHPAYAILLGLSLVGGLLLSALSLRKILRQRNTKPSEAKRIGIGGVVWRVLLIALGVAWIAILTWLRPFGAVEPALTAMQSDKAVTVTESATGIELHPAKTTDGTAVFFQPGARVDARAYAAVLRPLAEAGHTVVITKQPLNIAFLATGAFDAARSSHPDANQWVVAGHSLGGTVAAMEATETSNAKAPVAGLLFYASYPATDIRDSLKVPVASISGSRDGLATPAKIKASKANLPADAEFTVIEGASHAQFGAYGLQPGDSTPSISNEDARRQISDASVGFVGSLTQ